VTPPPLDVLKSIASLEANGDFARLISWLREQEATAVTELLDATSTVLVHQRQGYASALRDFLQSVTTASTALARLGGS
jgi:allophanate hydrolase subunit 1